MAGWTLGPTSGRTSTRGKATPVRRVLIAAVPPVDELDLVGPASVFAAANRLAGTLVYSVEIATSGTDLTIQGEGGLISFLATQRLDAARGPYDSVLVVSGVESRKRRDSALIAWLRAAAPRTQRLGAVCVSSFLLAEAGLLDGKQVAAHRQFSGELARSHPKLRVVSESGWVQDGTIFTSAGVSAGIDLALAWVKADLGAAVAGDIARDFETLGKGAGAQPPTAAALAAESKARRAVNELQDWIGGNLKKPLTAAALARKGRMSVGALGRAFRRETGRTLSQFVLLARVEAARTRLETTTESVDQVAAACGFTSLEAMRRGFQQTLGVSPAAFRRKRPIT
jgi:transcriptional regulator GlxA family with amidase domain